MFGKDRNKYVARDVMSDDEDMEADATALEMEEYRRLVPILTSHPTVKTPSDSFDHCTALAWPRKRTRLL
jgi:hypothetical protein